MSELDQMPHDAIGLVKWLDRIAPLPDALHMFASLTDEQHRLDMAKQLGQRMLVDQLKARYRLNA